MAEKHPSEPFIEDADRFPPDDRKKDRSSLSGQDARRRRTQQRRRRNSVFQYIAVLFMAAFVLLLYTFMMERRQSQQQINDLKQSNSAAQTLQGLIDENDRLKTEAKKLEEQVEELQRQLAAAEERQAALQNEIQNEEKVTLAMEWFWQLNDAYVRGRLKQCREMIATIEESQLEKLLPTENSANENYLSPAERYAEIRKRVIK